MGELLAYGDRFGTGVGDSEGLEMNGQVVLKCEYMYLNVGVHNCIESSK